MEKKRIIKLIMKKNIYVVLLFFAILFILTHSYSTIYNYGSENSDSAIFSAIGKFWAEGKIPYTDLFDHKGPIIFFINMLGWKIFNCVQGILLFQIISMFFLMVFLYKIASLEIQGNKKKILFTVLTVFFLTLTYGTGNQTEEYCLPFLAGTIYFTLKYIKNYLNNNISEHNCKYAFFYGISFAICFLTRLTNAISICASILTILIILIKNKNIKNIVLNVVFFILGFLILFLPFAIYFIMHNAFNEFLYGTILYNFQYAIATDSSKLVQNGNIAKSIIKYIVYFFPSYIIFIASAINIKKKRNIYGIFYIFLGIFETLLFIKLNTYKHYAIVTIPNVLIVLIEIEKLRISKLYKYIIYVLCVIIALMGLIIHYKNFKKGIPDYSVYDKLMLQIPKEERDSFIAFNINDYRRVYEHYNICPYYKYFVLQDWQASMSKELYEEMYDTFNNGNVKWILFVGNIEDTFISDILNRRYILIGEENNKLENMYLYCLND